jgi:type IV secretory pathway VirB9-like protein
MSYRWLIVVALLSSGCASGPPMPTHTGQAPMPADVGWRPPQVEMVEEVPAPPVVPRRPASPSERVFPYQEGQAQKIEVGVDTPLVLQFAADEVVVAVVCKECQPAADTPGESPRPWAVKIGEPGSKYPYVHVSVLAPRVTTGVSVVTSQRLYLLDLRSVAASKTRLVRWDYAPGPVSAVAKPRGLPDPLAARTYNVGYAVESQGEAPTWMPRQVVDDGHKVYVLFPPNLSVMEAPLARLIGPNGPELLNPRLVGSVMVVDHLFQRMEFRLGTTAQAPVVTVTRQTPQPIACPGASECPVWPQHLAQERRSR